MLVKIDNLEKLEASRDHLFHGTSIDALVSMLSDDAIVPAYRDYEGPKGISLTRSVDIARMFAQTHEDFFDDVDGSEIVREACGPGSKRQGAILIFHRAQLANRRLVTCEDADLGEEARYEEEVRVIGSINRLSQRLAGVMVKDAELQAYRNFLEVHDHSNGTLALIFKRMLASSNLPEEAETALIGPAV